MDFRLQRMQQRALRVPATAGVHLEPHQGFRMQRLHGDVVDMPLRVHVGVARFDRAMEIVGFQLASPVVIFHLQSLFSVLLPGGDGAACMPVILTCMRR